MRILFFGINYAPELTGIGKYTGEMGAWFARQGHDVHVITALPYYPEWEIHKTYKKKLWHTEVIEGVNIHRVPLYVPKDASSVKRIIHEFSFLVSTLPFWISFLFSKKIDVILCIAPPFHLAVIPWLYTRLKKSIWINHIQDLQVDAAKDLGMIKNETFLNIMFGLERFFLRKGNRVSTISEGMRKKVMNKGIDANHVILFPNWVDSQIIKPLSKEESLRKELGFLQQDKIVLYSGNLGEKQGLESIIRLAVKFKDDISVKFVICGSGGGKEKLQLLAKDSRLENVYFFPLQPYEKLSALLAMADLHLVLQKGSASDLVMPSKLTGILAAGGCVLVTALPGTSLYDVLIEHEMGIIVKPEDDEDLERGVKKGLFEDNAFYKQKARLYAEMHLDKDNILRQFELNLTNL